MLRHRGYPRRTHGPRLGMARSPPYLKKPTSSGRAKVELAGPLGGLLVWSSRRGADHARGGGSGVVHDGDDGKRAAAGDDTETRCYTPQAPRRRDLSRRARHVERHRPHGRARDADSPTSRLDEYRRAASTQRCSQMVAPSPGRAPRFYSWGPDPFVEAVAEAARTDGHDAWRSRRRFGPTGR